jgi:hypothetical protein
MNQGRCLLIPMVKVFYSGIYIVMTVLNIKRQTDIDILFFIRLIIVSYHIN